MRARPVTVVVLVTVLAAVVSLLGSCGLPRSSTPAQVPAADVPYGLLDSATASPTPTTTPGVPLVDGNIFLADPQQQLVAVSVQVPDGQAVPMLQTLLNRLAVGPTERERAQGLVTDLAPGSTIVLRNMSAGTATIELQTTGQDPSPSKLPIAVGQIVLTATSIVGVDRVVFVRDGTVVPVPGPSGGAQTSDALIAADYSALLGPGQPPIERTVPIPGVGTVTATTTTSR
jgi:hypothetical protein